MPFTKKRKNDEKCKWKKSQDGAVSVIAIKKELHWILSIAEHNNNGSNKMDKFKIENIINFHLKKVKKLKKYERF